MLGTVAGLWLSIILFVIVIAGSIGALIGSSQLKPVDKHSILYINLNGDIVERQQDQSLMEMLQNLESESPSLCDMIESIDAAKNDNRIDGIYIDAGGSAMGSASRQELVEAIERFKESGKWVYAYADNYTQGDYLIASTADKIFLNPVGNVDIRGIGGQVPFFTGLLDKLGIKVQVVKVGTYKSAVEPFILKSMSEAARRQNQIYIDSIWGYYSNTIAANREVEPSTVSAWADSLTFAWPAEKIVDNHIVTAIDYRRNVENMLRDLTETDHDKDLRLVSPAEYLAENKTITSDKKHIAVLYAVGDIVDSGKEGIAGDKFVPRIIDLADDDNVAALVLRVNSGGGSAFASEQIWEALQYFKSTGKPFYVSMGDVAASGGYYISCGADRIFADATTITGSIGVFGLIPDFSGLATDKLGITFSNVSTSPNATFMSLTQPLTGSQTASMQRYVEDTYDTFTSRVAEGRHMDVDSVKAIAEGRVWIGSTALEIGLVDTLGSLNDAIAAIAQEAGIDSKDVVTYPSINKELIDKLINESSNLTKLQNAVLDRETVKQLMFIRRLRDMSPIQARMPEIEIR